MEKEIKELKQTVDWLVKQVEMHYDGTPQQPHADATTLNAGFCTPEIASNAYGLALKDNNLNQKYTFWNIPFGLYATVYGWADEVPVPDDVSAGDLITLRVMGEDTQRKSYFMIVERTGALWYINTSQNTGSGGGNNNSVYWKRIPQITTLWKAGNSNCAVGSNMNFAVSTRRFRSLIFSIQGLGTYFTVRTPAVDNPVISFSCPASNIGSSYDIRIELSMVRDNIVLKYKKCRLVEHKSDGTHVFSEDTGFTISGVEGEY